MSAEEREFDRMLMSLDSSQSDWLDRKAKGMNWYRRGQIETLGEGLLVLEGGPMTARRLFTLSLGLNYESSKYAKRFLITKGYIEECTLGRSAMRYWRLTEKGFEVAELYKRAKALFAE